MPRVVIADRHIPLLDGIRKKEGLNSVSVALNVLLNSYSQAITTTQQRPKQGPKIGNDDHD